MSISQASGTVDRIQYISVSGLKVLALCIVLYSEPGAFAGSDSNNLTFTGTVESHEQCTVQIDSRNLASVKSLSCPTYLRP